jgi:hypothetical protein
VPAVRAALLSEVAAGVVFTGVHTVIIIVNEAVVIMVVKVVYKWWLRRWLKWWM